MGIGEQQRKEELTQAEMLRVIAKLVGSTVNIPVVEEYIQDSFDDSETINRYTVEGDIIYRQTVNELGHPLGSRKSTNFRKFLWNKLRLEGVSAQYEESYRVWKKENGG